MNKNTYDIHSIYGLILRYCVISSVAYSFRYPHETPQTFASKTIHVHVFCFRQFF